MWKRIILVLATLLCCGITVAVAGDQDTKADRGQRRLRPPVLIGDIISIQGDVLTLKPEIPAKMAQALEKRGRELPELPDEVKARITDETECYQAAKPAEVSAFKVGDKVALVLGRGAEDEVPAIRKMADIDTAQLVIEDKLRELREQRRGGPDGPGGRGGPGERGERRFQPLAGEITALNADSLTIKPEVPEFAKAKLEERGIEPPADLPEQVVVALTDQTRYLVNNEKSEANPFQVGDKVAVMGRPGPEDELEAKVVCDYATAQKRIEEMGPGGPEGEGMGPGGPLGPEGEMGPGGPGMPPPDGAMGPGGPGMDGPGGRGERRMRPVTGEITALSADSITIKVEIPEFVQTKMKERGIEAPDDMPKEVVLALNERTRFEVNSEKVEANPFKVGDKVAVMAGPGEDGEPVARMIADYATAEMRMAEMRERRGRGNGECEPGAGRPKGGEPPAE